MKKVILGLLSIIALYGCQKEKLNPQLSNNKSEKIRYELDKIPIIENTQDVSLLLTNPEDKDDEKINKYLYKLSLAVRELAKEKEFNDVIINLAKNSETQTANLLSLKTVSSKYYEALNSKLAIDGLSIQSIADDLTHAPVAPNPEFPETAEIETYVPAIFIPNLDKIDATLQPIISPNIEVDSRKDENIDDNIVAWYYDELGELKEIMLSEETSLNTTNPLFLLDNAVTTLKIEMNENAELQIEEESPVEGVQTKSSLSFSSYEHSIKSYAYRYEPWTSGKSEFAVNAYRIDPSGAVHWIYNGSGSKVISYIKKNQIGSIRYVWSHHASNWQPWSNPWTPNVTQYGVNMVFWNTFERDWNRSSKGLGTCSANGTTIYLAGRRKYTSEWYTWIPSTANIHYTRFQWIYDSWAHWNNSWKADFRLWRVGS